MSEEQPDIMQLKEALLRLLEEDKQIKRAVLDIIVTHVTDGIQSVTYPPRD